MNGSEVHPDAALWAAVLREFRLAKPLSLPEAAQRAGMCWQGLDKIEKGDCNPKLETVLRICQALEVPFVVVALVVDLRRDGFFVPLKRVYRLLRTLRRILGKITSLAAPNREKEKP